MKSGRTQVELIALYEELGSYRAVAALLGCDHKTVKRYVQAAGEAGQFAPALRRSRVTDDFVGLIVKPVIFDRKRKYVRVAVLGDVLHGELEALERYSH